VPAKRTDGEGHGEREGDGEGDGTGDVETSMRSARERIDALAVADGDFAVACKDAGVRPEPVADATFPTYDAAERACAAASRYRAALRSLDPSLAEYALVAFEEVEASVECSTVRETTDERRANGLPRSRQTVTLAGDRSDEWLRVENGPVVHLAGPEAPLDDEFVSRQLDSKLPPRER
jgi:hypothetical protein